MRFTLLFGLGVLLTSSASVAFADIISDELVVTRPGPIIDDMLITEAAEAAAPPGMPAFVTDTFLAVHGDYCVQTNCQPGQSNISPKEPGALGISDTLLARVEVFSPGLDRITVRMFSFSNESGGIDLGEKFDETNFLFTKSPTGFSVVEISGTPEPSTFFLMATVAGLCGVLVRRRVA
jgi:hypothetical protein